MICEVSELLLKLPLVLVSCSLCLGENSEIYIYYSISTHRIQGNVFCLLIFIFINFFNIFFHEYHLCVIQFRSDDLGLNCLQR